MNDLMRLQAIEDNEKDDQKSDSGGQFLFLSGILEAFSSVPFLSLSVLVKRKKREIRLIIVALFCSNKKLVIDFVEYHYSHVCTVESIFYIL